MIKFNKFIEQFWLVFAIISLIYAIYVSINNGMANSYNHYFIPGIALMWWLFRRGMRKRMEKNMENNTPTH